MTMYLRVAAVIAIVAVAGAAALYAFGSGPDVGSGSTPRPTASTVNPDAPLGLFDLDAFEGRFGFVPHPHAVPDHAHAPQAGAPNHKEPR